MTAAAPTNIASSVSFRASSAPARACARFITSAEVAPPFVSYLTTLEHRRAVLVRCAPAPVSEQKYAQQ